MYGPNVKIWMLITYIQCQDIHVSMPSMLNNKLEVAAGRARTAAATDSHPGAPQDWQRTADPGRHASAGVDRFLSAEHPTWLL